MAEQFCADFRAHYVNLFPSGTTVACRADQQLKTTTDVFSLISQIGSDNSAAQALTRDADTTAPTQTLIQDALKFCCTIENKKAVETQLRQAQEDNTVAKGRVSSVQNPAGDVSPRGTTFPFGKPLRSDSVPILLATSLAFLIMAMGLLLNLNNITISYSSPGGGPNL
jgi:hypothetical protein